MHSGLCVTTVVENMRCALAAVRELCVLVGIGDNACASRHILGQSFVEASMATRSAVTQLVRKVVSELSRGRPGDSSQLALESIGRTPELATELLSVMIDEGAKKRPNDGVLSACSYLLGHALEQVRYAVDRESPDGEALAELLRSRLLAAGAGGRISPPVMLLVLHLFASAKLEMGDDLRALLQSMMEGDSEARDQIEAGDWDRHLAEMVVEFNGDAFALYAFLDETITAMPEEMRPGFVTAMYAADDAAVREAAVGFLCCAWPAVRVGLAGMIEQSASEGAVSPTMLRRMIAVRNWLPANERPALDRAIKACRQHGVACASWPKAAAGRVLATGIDGSGAHSVNFILPDGRKYAFAAMLGKIGSGVRDAWVCRDMSKKDLKEVEERFATDAFLRPTSLAYAGIAVRAMIAMNVALETMPPFGLLVVAETVGLDDLNPVALPAARMVEDLLRDVPPERLAAGGVEAVLAASASWFDRHPMLETWFEDSEAVRRLLAKRGTKTKHQAALLAGPTLERRSAWADMLAWTALAAKHAASGTDWQDFAIVARELLGQRPLTEIPFALAIAGATVEIHCGT